MKYPDTGLVDADMDRDMMSANVTGPLGNRQCLVVFLP